MIWSFVHGVILHPLLVQVILFHDFFEGLFLDFEVIDGVQQRHLVIETLEYLKK